MDTTEGTIRKAITDIGYDTVATVKSKELADRNKEKRLNYGLLVRPMTAKDWEEYCFQDEKIFYCRCNFAKTTVQDPNLPPLSKKRESRWYGTAYP